MINEIEVPAYVGNAIPELSSQVSDKESCRNVYEMMDILLHYTHDNIETQNLNAVKKCFNVAEKLYNKGTEIVKNAVENVYVYSFSKIFHDKEKAKMVLGLIPITLYSLYIRQMLHSNL